MKIIGILYLTFNILLNLNEFYIKGNRSNNVLKFNNETLDMIENSIITCNNKKIMKTNGEITFKITDGNPKGIFRKIDVEYDLELNGFFIQKLPDNIDDQLSIRSMLCKATKKSETSDSKLYDQASDNYWVVFHLFANDFQEDKDHFIIRFQTVSTSVYDYDSNDSEIKNTYATIDVNTVVGKQPNLTDLGVDEKNYQSRINKKTFFLQIPKSGFDSYHIQKFELETYNNLLAKKIENDNTDFIMDKIADYISSNKTVKNKLLANLFKIKFEYNNQETQMLSKGKHDKISNLASKSKDIVTDVQDNNEDAQESNGFKSIISLMLCFQAILSSILIFV